MTIESAKQMQERGDIAPLVRVARAPHAPPGSLTLAAGACLLLGVVTLILGIALLPQAAWGALLGNLLFWAGLAQGGVVLAAVFHLSRARWGRVVERIAAGMGAFLPFSLPLFLLLWFGRGYLFPWMGQPERHPWLNTGWLFLRDGLALAVMATLSAAFLYRSLREPADPASVRRLAAATAIGFFPACGLLAVDLAMSPQTGFRSAIFPAIYLAGSFYAALTVTAVLAAVWRRFSGFERIIGPSELLDLGNLVWGLAAFQAYLWWAQYLIVWMANLPDEVGHHLKRWEVPPWGMLAWVALVGALVVPGVILASRGLKQRAPVLAIVGGVAALGMLLQRLLDILPYTGAPGSIGAALIVAGVSVGFLGAFFLPYLWLMRRVPVFPMEDPLFIEALLVRDVNV